MIEDNPVDILNKCYAEISCTKNSVACITDIPGGFCKLDANFIIQSKLLYGFELDAGNNLIYVGNTSANFSCSMILRSETSGIKIRLRKNFSEFTELNFSDGIYSASLLLNTGDSIEIFVASTEAAFTILDFKLSVHI